MSGFSTVTNSNKMSSVALQAAQNAVSRATIGILRNVDAVAAEDNNALLYNAANEKWESKSLTSVPTIVPQNIEDLKDVSTTAPTNGQVLKYVDGTGLWTPGATGALSADLGELGDVDVITLPQYNGASLQFNGTDWITAPSDAITIWATAGANGGSNSNTGLETGLSVADMPTAFQRALQKGSVVSSKINLKLADVPWDTSTKNLYNTNLLNGPSFTTFNINGSSQDFSAADGSGTSRTTGSALTGYAITNATSQTISNGWDCVAFPTTIHWGEVTVNGATRTLPVLVDDQTQNTGIRVYMTYWDYATSSGFTATPTFKQRALTDSTIITHSASFHGPMSFTNIIVKCPDAGEIKFLNDVSMQYAEIRSTTPTTLTNITYVGKNTQCSFCRFTDITFSCRGTSLTVSGMTGSTFVNCIFYNCNFIEADNVSFVGCIFYKNPLLFDKKSSRVVMQGCTFIYSHGAGDAALANITSGGHLQLELGVIDLQQYASGHIPLTKPIFIANVHSDIELYHISVVDAVLDVSTNSGPFASGNDECAFALVRNHSDLKAAKVTIVDTGAGNYPIFVAREMSTIHIMEGDYKVNAHVFATAGNGSNLGLSKLDDKIQCAECIVADRSFINLEDVTIKVGGAYVMTGDFLTTTLCEVAGGGRAPNTGIYVDSSHTDTKFFINDRSSKISIDLMADSATTDMYGRINLDHSELDMRVVDNSTIQKITLVNGTTNAGHILLANASKVYLSDISIKNTHVTDGGCIQASARSNVNLFYNIFTGANPNNIECLDGVTLQVLQESSLYISGAIGAIKNTANDRNVVNCMSNSTLQISSSITVAQAANWKTVLQRNSAGTGTAAIVNVGDNSKFSFRNHGTNRLTTPGAAAINIAAPEILLKGETTNTGLGPMAIFNNSLMIIELSNLTFNKLNGPCTIHNGSKLSLLQCVLTDDSTSDERLSYFNPVDSEVAINGLGSLTVLYTPLMLIRIKDDITGGTIRGSNSKIILADMEIQNQTTVGTNQSLIVAEDGSSVSYLNPKKTTNLGFSTGVLLRSNSKCVYKDAGSDQLDCTQDIVLGLLAGASTNKQRKLIDIGDGSTTIIPVLAASVTGDFAALQTYIDAAEGCGATIKV